MAYGQVYATLARLSRSGLIDVASTDSGAGPERTVYDLTPVGSTELHAWIAQPADAAPFVANELFTKVVVAILAGDSAADCLKAQRATHMQRMRQLTAIKTDPAASMADVLSADFALSHLDADLRWMATTAGRLNALATEVNQ
jgi:DNA-binding PadR family transcriptional regulator